MEYKDIVHRVQMNMTVSTGHALQDTLNVQIVNNVLEWRAFVIISLTVKMVLMNSAMINVTRA